MRFPKMDPTVMAEASVATMMAASVSWSSFRRPDLGPNIMAILLR